MSQNQPLNNANQPPVPRLMRPVGLTLLATLAGMSAYELVKSILWPEMTLWQSHLVTIVFSSVLAAAAAGMIWRKFIYHQQIETVQEYLAAARAQQLHQAQTEIEHQQRLLLALSQIAQAVQRAHSTAEIYQLVGEEAAKLGYNAAVFTLAADRTHLHIHYLRRQSSASLQAVEKLTDLSGQNYRYPLEPGGVYEQLITTGETTFFDPFTPAITEALPKALRPLAGQIVTMLNIPQGIIAPLNLNGQIMGILIVSGQGLTSTDVTTVTAVANQIAIALKNVRLYQSLRESEEKYRTLVESQGEGVGIVDLAERFVFANPAADEIFGAPAGSLIGRSLQEFTNADSFAIMQAQTQLRQAGQTSVYEMEITRLDGQRRVLLITATPQFDADRHFTGTFGVFRDITQRKQTEQELQRRVTELSALNTMATIVSQSLDGAEILNRAIDEALQSIGVEAAVVYLPNKDTHELVMAAHRGIIADLSRIVSQVKPEITTSWLSAQGGAAKVIQIRAKDTDALKPLEKEHTLSLAQVPLIGVAGVIGMMYLGASRPECFDAPGLKLLTSLGQQIAIGLEKARLYAETHAWAAELDRRVRERTADLVASEKALRESEVRYRIVSELTADYVFILKVEADGQVVMDMVTDNFFAITGRTLAEVKTPGLWAKIFPTPEDYALVMKSMQTVISGQSVELECRTLVKDNQQRWVQIFARPQWDEAQQRVVAIVGAVKDITARKQAEEALKQYSERLEERVAERTQELRAAQEQLLRREKLAMLGQLAGSVAHELRNPLGAVKNIVYFLKVALTNPTPEVAQSLEILNKEVDRSDRIISSLLDFARSKQPSYQQVNLNKVIEQALAQVTTPETIEVVPQLADTLPFFQADPEQLAQVFNNLLLNAIQAMSPPLGKGGQLVVKTTLEKPLNSADIPPAWAVIAISDTGVGMSPENQAKLFEPLFTTKAKGIGLGLPLVKMFVDGHGGIIDVASEEGAGSTFTVKLPIIN